MVLPRANTAVQDKFCFLHRFKLKKSPRLCFHASEAIHWYASERRSVQDGRCFLHRFKLKKSSRLCFHASKAIHWYASERGSARWAIFCLKRVYMNHTVLYIFYFILDIIVYCLGYTVCFVEGNVPVLGNLQINIYF